jgi:eIF-2B alpha/beta/delta-like uncharacterized protein
MKAEMQLKEIEKDNSKGASEILLMARNCLHSFTEEIAFDSKEEFLEGLANFGLRMVNAQPSMAPLFNYINNILTTLEDSLDVSLDNAELINGTIRISDEFISNSLLANEKIKKQVLNIIKNGSTIMTHSYSSTVIQSLTYARDAGKEFTVIVPEARPVLEGHRTARIFSENGIDTQLITDMATFSFFKEVDMVLTGCDTLCKIGVVNKIGTLGMAMAAKSYRIPFYVAGERSKFLPSKYLQKPIIERKEPREIMKDPGSIEIINIYFDITPYDLVTGIINEDGISASHQIEKLLDGLKVSSTFMQ